MKTQILGALALALASQACTTDDQLGTTSADLSISPSAGTSNHFYWAAYDHEPYIYKGCPDPGPEPWRDPASLRARRGTSVIELELGTAVALDVRALSLPRGMRLAGHARGATLSVDDPYATAPVGFSMLVTSGRCSYEVEAEIAYQ